MLLSELTLFVMPKSKIVEELTKKNLIVYSQRKDDLNYYLPDELKAGQVERNFLLNVKLNFKTKDNF